MNDPLTGIGTKIPTVQTESARPDQVENHAGGFVFEVSPETRIRRFLILGTTGNTYYQTQKELTKDNADVVIDWATNRTHELVNLILEISEAGRAPKQNQAIFALAAASALGSVEDRQYARSVVPRVCRTLSTLYMYVMYYSQFRGWSRGSRRAVGSWFNEKSVDDLAYQVTKYRNRNGWTADDLLASAHPTIDEPSKNILYRWLTNSGGLSYEDRKKIASEWEAGRVWKRENAEFHEHDLLPNLVKGFISAQDATTVSVWVNLIENNYLSWEMLPDAALSEPAVWIALIEKGMPMTALVRQLPRLTNLGLFKLGSSLTATVVNQLTNQEKITKSRLHPVNVLLAQQTYASGYSVRGNSVWDPNTKIVDALDEAFYKAFGNVKPANKRTLNALDVSGSMGAQIGGLPITCRAAAGAMSLVTVATEPEVVTVGFTGGSRYSNRGLLGYASDLSNRERSQPLEVLNISARQRLDDVVRTIDRQDFGTTDCSLPMIWAKEQSLEFDTFLVWTDSETWHGRIHPFQALREYREASGIDARLVVCGMTATNFSIADPRDAGMLDVTGFDSAVPNLIADFSAGRV